VVAAAMQLATNVAYHLCKHGPDVGHRLLHLSRSEHTGVMGDAKPRLGACKLQPTTAYRSVRVRAVVAGCSNGILQMGSGL
jgi:hypothetical protein